MPITAKRRRIQHSIGHEEWRWLWNCQYRCFQRSGYTESAYYHETVDVYSCGCKYLLVKSIRRKIFLEKASRGIEFLLSNSENLLAGKIVSECKCNFFMQTDVRQLQEWISAYFSIRAIQEFKVNESRWYFLMLILPSLICRCLPENLQLPAPSPSF